LTSNTNYFLSGKPKKPITVQLEHDLVDIVDNICQEVEISRSEFVNYAVKTLIMKIQKEANKS